MIRRNSMKYAISVVFVYLFVLVGSVYGQQDIDEFTMKEQGKWNCAKTIALRLFQGTDEFKGEKSQEYYQKIFADKLAAELKKIVGIEKVDVVDEKAVPAADIVIEGKFIDLTTGSRALRFWVGLGAGKSFCRVDMKGIDTKSSAVVFTLDHARGSAMDIVNSDELMENIDEVVEDIGAGLTKFRKGCDLPPSSEK